MPVANCGYVRALPAADSNPACPSKVDGQAEWAHGNGLPPLASPYSLISKLSPIVLRHDRQFLLAIRGTQESSPFANISIRAAHPQIHAAGQNVFTKGRDEQATDLRISTISHEHMLDLHSPNHVLLAQTPVSTHHLIILTPLSYPSKLPWPSPSSTSASQPQIRMRGCHNEEILQLPDRFLSFSTKSSASDEVYAPWSALKDFNNASSLVSVCPIMSKETPNS
ncbi:uncharacterized protein CLUP02_03641 [Colletotrichum lupini]|uniref:Uncharacterized protein n=1 Tax=Colletotrichum lupini TaxID=145971 RepID=A0A9Q8SIV7_9PEZI|nr:uncharacterized protein CLUP02_03641 [Colletotrichum lupini]UQC78166.1 hypothetical protein CLUP02_03641 [Colletotrichum lupini]